MQRAHHDWRFRATLAGIYVALVAMPHLLSFSQKEIAVFLVINVLVVVSYRLLTLTGEWSLAHAVLMGVGAYASALLAKRLGVPVPPAMLLGAVAAALVAWVLSFPLFRMKAFYFLIGSFAAGEIIRLCWKRFREPFGGPKGIKLIPSVPDVEIGGAGDCVLRPRQLLLPVPGRGHPLAGRPPSPGALPDRADLPCDPLAGPAGGVGGRRHPPVPDPRLRHRLVLRGPGRRPAGALLGTVNPNQFDVEAMVYVLIWVIVGGTATIYGPILGVAALTVVNEIVLRGLGVDQARPLVYGAILIASILFLPDGFESLGPKMKRAFARIRGRAGQP